MGPTLMAAGDGDVTLALVLYCLRQSLYALFMPGRGIPPLSSGALRGFGFLPAYLAGGHVVAAGMLVNLSDGLLQACRVFFLLFLCRVLSPRPWMSVIAFVGAMGLMTGAFTESWWSDTRWIENVSLLVVYVLLTLLVIVRFGFLTFAVWGWIGGMVETGLVTNQFGAWYGQSSLAVLVIISALTVWAFWTSIGRPSFDRANPLSP
jgi:hypothetical protein